MKEESNNENIERGFYPRFKLYKCCSKNPDRPRFRFIHFENGYAYATDGHIAVCARIQDICNFTPVELGMLDGKSIDMDHFRSLLGMQSLEVKENGIEAKSDSGNVMFFFDKQLSLNFPNVDSIFSSAHAKTGQYQTEAFGMNASSLQKLVDAMGCKKVKVRLTGEKSAILVTDIEGELDIEGIIMPILLDGK